MFTLPPSCWENPNLRRIHIYIVICCCCLPTPLTFVCGGESDHPVFSPTDSLSLHLAAAPSMICCKPCPSVAAVHVLFLQVFLYRSAYLRLLITSKSYTTIYRDNNNKLNEMFNFNTMKKIGTDTTHGVSIYLCQLWYSLYFLSVR